MLTLEHNLEFLRMSLPTHSNSSRRMDLTKLHLFYTHRIGINDLYVRELTQTSVPRKRHCYGGCYGAIMITPRDCKLTHNVFIKGPNVWDF